MLSTITPQTANKTAFAGLICDENLKTHITNKAQDIESAEQMVKTAKILIALAKKPVGGYTVKPEVLSSSRQEYLLTLLNTQLGGKPAPVLQIRLMQNPAKNLINIDITNLQKGIDCGKSYTIDSSMVNQSLREQLKLEVFDQAEKLFKPNVERERQAFMYILNAVSLNIGQLLLPSVNG